MKITVFGGTGDLGRGLAMRLSRRHDVVVGSRDEERAKSTAAELRRAVEGHDGGLLAGAITGEINSAAVEGSAIVVLAVPADSLEGFLGDAKGFDWGGQIVLSPVTRFLREGGVFTYKPYSANGKVSSAAELVQDSLGEAVRVVAGLHCVPAARLADLADPLGFDVPLAGPRDAVTLVSQTIEGVEGLRPLFAGPLSLSTSLESLAPLLVNISARNKIKEPGFRVVA